MEERDIRDICRENYHKNGLISHLICFFLGLLACSIIAAGSFFVDLLILVIPFIALPILFSCFASIILLRDQKMLTFGGFLNCFTSYFKEKFRSTFQVMRSFWISLLIYFLFSIIFTISLNLSFYNSNWHNYAVVFDELVKMITVSEQAVEDILKANSELIDLVAIYNFVPTMFVFSVSFIYLTDHYSISLFHRLQTPQLTGRTNLFIQRNVIRNNKAEYYKLYFKLNWPFYLIYIVTFVGTAIGAYFIKTNYHFIYIFALVFSLFASYGLYGPYHLAANEAIYIKLKDKYDNSANELLNMLTNTLQSYIDKYKEELETKKDSDESH